MSLLGIFATAILPIITIAGLGFLLGRWKDVEADALHTVTVYVLAPALAFHSLGTTDLGSGAVAGIAVGVFVFTGVMTLLSEGVGRGLAHREPLLGSFVLVSVFANAGNLGIPVSEFAFGEVGRSTAVVYLVSQSVMMYTLGVYLAARGDGSDWRSGLKTVVTIPLVYAVIAALLFRGAGLLPPANSATMETIGLVGDSAIPVMLLILGIELAHTDYGSAAFRVSPAVALKLLVAPLVAVPIAVVIGFENRTVARVFVLECAMPAAVTTLILTGEFSAPGADLEAAEFAGTAILASTLLSIPLLTLFIALLQTGLVL
ncbi:MAG: AEC family transporter [Halovenus sp.]